MAKKDKIFVDTEFYLKYPFSESVGTLLSWANLNRMKNLISSTEKKISIIRVPLSVFERIFKSRPQIGKSYSVPNGAEKFLVNIIVKDIFGL